MTIDWVVSQERVNQDRVNQERINQENQRNRDAYSRNEGERKRNAGKQGLCPPPEDIRPCTCDSQNLRCFSTVEFDFEHVFKTISLGKSDEELKWNTLEISSPIITDLKDSIFHGVSFQTVKFIHCNQLNCISPTAFYGMERTIEHFIAYDTGFRLARS